MRKSHKSCMDQAEIIETFGTYQEPGGGATPWCPLRPIFTPHSRNPRDGTLFAISSYVPPPSRFQDWDSLTNLTRHPAGGRIDLRELLRHHERFPNVP